LQRIVVGKSADGKWAYGASSAPEATKTVKIGVGPLKTHSVHMSAPTTPGAYQLEFAGDGATHLSAPNADGWLFVRGDKSMPRRAG